jgi:hypothetical protein
MTREVMPSSEWCQRWNLGTHSWRHTREGGFDPRRYAVAPLNEPSAKCYVEAHHYSHTYPAARLRYGLFERDRLSGVLVLGVPMRASVLTNVFPQLEPFYESLELSRMVLADRVPANGETWFMGRAFRLAARDGVRGLVCFADPVGRMAGGRLVFPGHVGICYQAHNAAYLGRSTPRTLVVLPDGTTLSARARQKVVAQERGHEYVEQLLVRHGARPLDCLDDPARWLAEALTTVGAGRLRHGGCHRYGFRLGREARRVQLKAVGGGQYPKRGDIAG